MELDDALDAGGSRPRDLDRDDRSLGRSRDRPGARRSIVADRDLPPFDRATMDGIAVRFDDLTPGSRWSADRRRGGGGTTVPRRGPGGRHGSDRDRRRRCRAARRRDGAGAGSTDESGSWSRRTTVVRRTIDPSTGATPPNATDWSRPPTVDARSTTSRRSRRDHRRPRRSASGPDPGSLLISTGDELCGMTGDLDTDDGPAMPHPQRQRPDDREPRSNAGRRGRRWRHGSATIGRRRSTAMRRGRDGGRSRRDRRGTQRGRPRSRPGRRGGTRPRRGETAASTSSRAVPHLVDARRNGRLRSGLPGNPGVGPGDAHLFVRCWIEASLGLDPDARWIEVESSTGPPRSPNPRRPMIRPAHLDRRDGPRRSPEVAE